MVGRGPTLTASSTALTAPSPPYAIISPSSKKPETDQMEAERLIAIENLLADLRRRAGELRGYL